MVHIELSSLAPGYHEITLEPAPEEIGLEAGDFRNILVEVGLDYDGTSAFVSLKASAIAALVCDRTLIEFEQSIAGDYRVLFSPEEGQDEDVVPISPTEEIIDITDIVRDTLLLSVPVRKIAPGAEEEEIPVAFGEPADSDVDPRWEALKALKNENGDSV